MTCGNEFLESHWGNRILDVSIKVLKGAYLVEVSDL